jgi:16S rRNA (guanine966-N2)-methyltransferase
MGSLRITGGMLNGRRISVPAGGQARYTSSKVRAAIFNMVGDVADCEVLDLFAGSGSLSIESLSRGARHAVCVEKDGQMAALLRQNLERTGLERHCVVLNMDVIYAVPHLARQGRLFDLILMDPPYEMGHVSTVIGLLVKHGLWRDGCTTVVEHSRREKLPPFPAYVRLVRSKLYGDTAVSLIRCEARQI